MSATKGEWLTRKQASEFLFAMGCPITPQHMERMALHNNAGKGPPYVKSGKRLVRYNREEVRQWAEKNIKRVA